MIHVLQVLKEKQRKAKTFYLHSQESQKKLMERLSQEEVRKKIMKSVKDGMLQWNLVIALINIHYLYNILKLLAHGVVSERFHSELLQKAANLFT